MISHTGRTRAAAMPVEERRAAIVQAALPLFLEHGAAVTTREIAQAADIAEGTIFRVFDDKIGLLDAVIDAALDPAPVEAALATIDPSLTFDAQLIAAVDILRARVAHVFGVLSAASTVSTSDGSPRKRNRGPAPEFRGLVRLFESQADQLTHDPVDSARLLRGMTFAGTHPAFAIGKPLSSKEIVSAVLDGIRRLPSRDDPC